ncbi:MAG: hypothetical protein IJ048_10815 [Clostridia bacterium]|nr:hypothetical protein [Clostridia bacterium]
MLFQYDELTEKLLKKPYWVVDILPEQVPGDAGGQYFAVERYFLQREQIVALRLKFARILLKLNCYCDMAVSFDAGENWEKNPEPAGFAQRVACLSGGAFLRVVFESQETMIDLDTGDTWMTVFGPNPAMLDRVRKLAGSEGLFVWCPPESIAL